MGTRFPMSWNEFSGVVDEHNEVLRREMSQWKMMMPTVVLMVLGLLLIFYAHFQRRPRECHYWEICPCDYWGWDFDWTFMTFFRAGNTVILVSACVGSCMWRGAVWTSDSSRTIAALRVKLSELNQ